MDFGSVTPIGDTHRGGVAVVRGLVHGTPVVAFCTDATRMGGALGYADLSQRIVDAVETAHPGALSGDRASGTPGAPN